jgi:predicted anti-sigma-YlaC factor YlaD
MGCPRKSIIDRYVDGEVDSTEKESIGRHLESCTLCAAYFQSLQALRSSMRALDIVEVPESFAAVTMERVERAAIGERSHGRISSPRWRDILKRASILTAAVILCALLYGPFTSIVDSVRELPSMGGGISVEFLRSAKVSYDLLADRMSFLATIIETLLSVSGKVISLFAAEAVSPALYRATAIVIFLCFALGRIWYRQFQKERGFSNATQ